MPEFTLLRGTHRRADGSRAEAGEVVELTERQTEQFNMDRFERVESAAPSSDDAADTTADDADERPATEASGDLPSDWEMLRAMAVVYDGTEVNGNSSQEDVEAFFGDFSDTEIAALKQQATDRLYATPADADVEDDDDDADESDE